MTNFRITFKSGRTMDLNGEGEFKSIMEKFIGFNAGAKFTLTNNTAINQNEIESIVEIK